MEKRGDRVILCRGGTMLDSRSFKCPFWWVFGLLMCNISRGEGKRGEGAARHLGMKVMEGEGGGKPPGQSRVFNTCFRLGSPESFGTAVGRRKGKEKSKYFDEELRGHCDVDP